MQIREAVAADLATISAMGVEFQEHLNSIADAEPVVSTRCDNLADLAFGPAPLCHVLIATDGDNPAGYLVYDLGVQMDDTEITAAVFVAEVFVRPALQQRGIGRALMTEAFLHGRRRGATQLPAFRWPGVPTVQHVQGHVHERQRPAR